jgi:hypothetical protein
MHWYADDGFVVGLLRDDVLACPAAGGGPRPPAGRRSRCRGPAPARRREKAFARLPVLPFPITVLSVYLLMYCQQYLAV